MDGHAWAGQPNGRESFDRASSTFPPALAMVDTEEIDEQQQSNRDYFLSNLGVFTNNRPLEDLNLTAHHSDYRQYPDPLPGLPQPSVNDETNARPPLIVAEEHQPGQLQASFGDIPQYSLDSYQAVNVNGWGGQDGLGAFSAGGASGYNAQPQAYQPLFRGQQHFGGGPQLAPNAITMSQRHRPMSTAEHNMPDDRPYVPQAGHPPPPVRLPLSRDDPWSLLNPRAAPSRIRREAPPGPTESYERRGRALSHDRSSASSNFSLVYSGSSVGLDTNDLSASTGTVRQGPGNGYGRPPPALEHRPERQPSHYDAPGNQNPAAAGNAPMLDSYVHGFKPQGQPGPSGLPFHST